MVNKPRNTADQFRSLPPPMHLSPIKTSSKVSKKKTNRGDKGVAEKLKQQKKEMEMQEQADELYLMK